MAKEINTLIVGGGQAGLAMSSHLSEVGINHLIIEKGLIAQKWRSERWDSLVMNGPAWHDRFPAKKFEGCHSESFPNKDAVVSYFEAFAEQINAPINCGVEVKKVRPIKEGGFLVKTTSGIIHAKNVVVATGPFQIPIIPPIVSDKRLTQIHSSDYRNSKHLREGAVLVVGSGSSGSQIADELLSAGRKVFLSVGPHDRPPRTYRGKDYVWWLSKLGKWRMKAPAVGQEHVTIAVSGANGGKTIDFRELANRGITLLGRVKNFQYGIIELADDLALNIANGDEYYLDLLEEADEYINKHKLSFPREEEAKVIIPAPDCIDNPIMKLDLEKAGVKNIIWATGYSRDFSWLEADVFDSQSKPIHRNGVADVQGLYFLGLPWLSTRGSSFIWGVWEDAKYLASHLARC